MFSKKTDFFLANPCCRPTVPGCYNEGGNGFRPPNIKYSMQNGPGIVNNTDTMRADRLLGVLRKLFLESDFAGAMEMAENIHESVTQILKLVQK